MAQVGPLLLGILFLALLYAGHEQSRDRQPSG
jgi:hypothetical protein